jgi:endoribonuclease LACTB2
MQRKPVETRDQLGPPTIINAGYRSTNYWIVSAGRSRLLVDLGWPGMMGMMRATLARLDVPLEEIGYGLATHFHTDHAGHAQELKNAGMKLLVMESQTGAISLMKKHIKPRDNYLDISTGDNIVLTFAGSRDFLRRIGIAGEVLPTPGHSPDSVSLLLDDGSVFTGDLTHPAMIDVENDADVIASWRLLRACGAARVYAGHGPVRPMFAI